MARPKKPKPRLPTLEEQLAEHMRDAPFGKDGDAYEQAYRREWVKRRNELLDAIRHRDAKRTTDDTVEIAIDDPEDKRKRRKNTTRAKQSEAFRHNQLDGMQQQAQIEMDKAYRLKHRVGPSRSNFGPRTGGGAPQESTVLEATWVDWCVRAVERRIMVPAVMDCLFEVKTLTEIERDHRMRRGQALIQFKLALDLWSELRGWLRGPRMQVGPSLMPEGPTIHLDK